MDAYYYNLCKMKCDGISSIHLMELFLDYFGYTGFTGHPTYAYSPDEKEVQFYLSHHNFSIDQYRLFVTDHPDLKLEMELFFLSEDNHQYGFYVKNNTVDCGFVDHFYSYRYIPEQNNPSSIGPWKIKPIEALIMTIMYKAKGQLKWYNKLKESQLEVPKLPIFPVLSQEENDILTSRIKSLQGDKQ